MERIRLFTIVALLAAALVILAYLTYTFRANLAKDRLTLCYFRADL